MLILYKYGLRRQITRKDTPFSVSKCSPVVCMNVQFIPPLPPCFITEMWLKPQLFIKQVKHFHALGGSDAMCFESREEAYIYSGKIARTKIS